MVKGLGILNNVQPVLARGFQRVCYWQTRHTSTRLVSNLPTGGETRLRQH